MALAGQYELDRAIGQACVSWICQGGWLASSQMDRGTPHRRAPLVWAGGDRPGGGFRAPLPKPLPYRLRPQAWLEWGRPYRVGSLARRSGVADRDDALVASRWKGHRGADPTDVGDRWPPPPRACRGWHGGPPPASQPGLTDVRIARDWDVFNLGRVQAVEKPPRATSNTLAWPCPSTSDPTFGAPRPYGNEVRRVPGSASGIGNGREGGHIGRAKRLGRLPCFLGDAGAGNQDPPRAASPTSSLSHHLLSSIDRVVNDGASV